MYQKVSHYERGKNQSNLTGAVPIYDLLEVHVKHQPQLKKFQEMYPKYENPNLKMKQTVLQEGFSSWKFHGFVLFYAIICDHLCYLYHAGYLHHDDIQYIITSKKTVNLIFSRKVWTYCMRILLFSSLHLCLHVSWYLALYFHE